MVPYSWKKTEYANPGAENYAFVPNMTLPPHAIQAGANLTVDQINVFQPPQIYSAVTVPMAGYGGLVAGQLIQQPLSKDENK